MKKIISFNQIFDSIKPELMNIIKYPNKSLYRISEEVDVFDDNLLQLITNMFYTMEQNNGIGLAAIQVGVPKRILIMDIDRRIIMINPIIVDTKGTIFFEEGCLSVPDVKITVKRAEQINVRYRRWDGDFSEMVVRGLPAICIQHEMDHLDGKLFLQYKEDE